MQSVIYGAFAWAFSNLRIHSSAMHLRRNHVFSTHSAICDAFNYVQVGDGTTAATDDAANPTRAIPGELVYMYGALTPKQDDYKAKTGG